MPRYRLERAAALALALSVTACAGAGAPRTPGAVTPTGGPTVALDEAALRDIAELLRIEDRREYDESTLRNHLGSVHPTVRRQAATSAGRIRDPRAVPALLTALDDPDPTVRAEAAFALGQIGDTATSVVTILSGRALDPAEDQEVRIEAASALGKLRTNEAKRPLEAILERAAATVGRERSGSEATASEAALAGEALLAIWKFTRTPGMTETIVRLAGSGDPELRWRAIYSLMRLRDPATVTTLLEYRDDPDPLVRALAMRGLDPTVVDSAGERAAAVAALTAAVEDSHPHVRINALRALAAFRIPASIPTLARGISDEDANVSLTAIESLGGVGGDRAAELLEPIANDPETRLALRAAALTGLLRIAPNRGAEIARGLARDPEWLNRFYAARALGAAPTEEGIALLSRELAYDPDPRVASTALSGLASTPAELAPGLERLFIEQLGAADVGIRAAALRGLARRATAAQLPALLDAYDRARHDVDNDAARAAVTALAALAERGVPVERSFFLRFPRSPDPIVRREVVEKLGPGSWGEAFPIETGRTPEFYYEMARGLVFPYLSGQPRPRAVISTGTGTITIELAAADAPLTVYNFISLARDGYFDGFRWHRVVPNFVLQDGDPRGDGLGGPGYSIRDEINRRRYLRGTVGMALDGPDTGGSQFFITHAPQPHLDGGYTIFGEVVEGIEVADRVAQDDPIHRIIIEYPGRELPPPPTGTVDNAQSRARNDRLR